MQVSYEHSLIYLGLWFLLTCSVDSIIHLSQANPIHLPSLLCTDPRAGARIRSSVYDRMLPPAEVEHIFRSYSQPDAASTSDNHPVLGYERFLAAVVGLRHALRRPDQVSIRG